MSDEVLFEVQGALGVITLNRPKALNALTLPMILALHHHLLLWQKDDAIRAVVIRSLSDGIFCAGGDVRHLYQQGREQTEEQMRFFWHEYRLNHLIHHFGKPYIALLDGVTMGGGVGISLHASHALASERFVFSMPETGIGFFPDIGASYLLTRCPESIGIYLGLTGARLSAQEADNAGLIKARMSSEAMSLFFQELSQWRWTDDAYDDVMRCLAFYQIQEHSSFPEIDAIKACFSLDSVEDMCTALARHGVWGMRVLNELKHKSPLSLKVTLAQLHKAKGYSLAQCLTLDYEMAGHFMLADDFYEGIRALLIDKDKNPRWNPAVLDDVDELLVSQYLQPILTDPLALNK